MLKKIDHLYNKRRNSYKNYGKVYTTDIVANKMIEYINFYSIDKNSRILEPSFGKGVFYFKILEKLLKNYDVKYIVENILYGVELDVDDFDFVVHKLKTDFNYNYCSDTKIFNYDFLLFKFNTKFDYIIGNPPYVSYKNLHSDMYERKDYIKLLNDEFDTTTTSDLYVNFFIKTFRLLKDNSRHIFICSDSWINSNFGKVLRDEIEKYTISYLITSPYEYFFDFDTNAIITVIDNHSSSNETVLYYDGFDQNKRITCDVKYLIRNRMRNILCVYPNIINSEFIINLKNQTNSKISDFVNLEKSNLTFNNIVDIVNNESNDTSYKIFFQDQARVNKPALYKNNISLDELKYSIDKEKVDSKLFKNNNIYISSIIDRIMLIFWVTDNQPTIHTSKYYSLKFNDDMDRRLIYFLLINPITQINLEIYLKESTKRSKRRGEMGFAKEIDDKKLIETPTINIKDLKESTIKKMFEYLDKWQDTIEINIENIYKREDYKILMKEIFSELNINNFDDYIEKSLSLYYKRMRNIKYRI